MEANKKKPDIMSILIAMKEHEESAMASMDKITAIAEAFIIEEMQRKKKKKTKKKKPPKTDSVRNDSIATGRVRRAAATVSSELIHWNFNMPAKLRRPSIVEEDGIYRPPIDSIKKNTKRTTNLSNLPVVDEAPSESQAQSGKISVKECSVRLQVLSVEDISPKKVKVVLNRDEVCLENNTTSTKQSCASCVVSPNKKKEEPQTSQANISSNNASSLPEVSCAGKVVEDSQTTNLGRSTRVRTKQRGMKRKSDESFVADESTIQGMDDSDNCFVKPQPPPRRTRRTKKNNPKVTSSSEVLESVLISECEQKECEVNEEVKCVDSDDLNKKITDISLKPDELEEQVTKTTSESMNTEKDPEREVNSNSEQVIHTNNVDDEGSIESFEKEGTTNQVEVEEDNPAKVVTAVVKSSPIVPTVRMTRTKTKEMRDKHNINGESEDLIPKTVGNPNKKVKFEPSGKENKNLSAKQYQFLSANKNFNSTPLIAFNTPGTTSASKIANLLSAGSSTAKINFFKRELDNKQKGDLVFRKKEEQIKQVSEKIRKKREMKMNKVTAQKKVFEKEKQEHIAKMEKERIEKEKLIMAEKERKKEEILIKKQLKQQKLQEAEERRMKEEQARLARLKELEEEQKRQAELRLKQEEEAERLRQQRLAEEIKLKEAQELQKKAEILKAKEAALKETVEYDMTPVRHERIPLPPKCPEDYGISDAEMDDSSDDESKPKKVIPHWAKRGVRERAIYIQSIVNPDIICTFLPVTCRTPSINTLFNEPEYRFKRTSSAFWPSP